MYSVNYGMLQHGNRYNHGFADFDGMGKLTPGQKKLANQTAKLHAIEARIVTVNRPGGQVAQQLSERQQHQLARVSHALGKKGRATLTDYEKMLVTKVGRAAILNPHQIKALQRRDTANAAATKLGLDAQAADLENQRIAAANAAQAAWLAAHPDAGYVPPTDTGGGTTGGGSTYGGGSGGGGGGYQAGVARGEDEQMPAGAQTTPNSQIDPTTGLPIAQAGLFGGGAGVLIAIGVIALLAFRKKRTHVPPPRSRYGAA